MRKHVLVLGAELYEQLRSEVFASSPLETACYVLARPVHTPRGAYRLVAHEIVTVADSEYNLRTPTRIVLPPSVLARVAQQARTLGSSVILVHSHPFGDPTPSQIDLDGEGQIVPFLQRRVPSASHGRLILSADRLSAALFEPEGTEVPLSVVVVSEEVRILEASSDTRVSPTYDRQVRAFGYEGQQQLANLRVAIVGLGGTGSVVAQQLAYLGVQRFLLVDPDVIEHSNLNRVLGSAPSDVGRSKVDVAAAMIAHVNPNSRVQTIQGDIRDDTVARALLDTDVFMACTDSQGSRHVLSQLAYQYLLPGIDVGVAIHAAGGAVSHISGRVQMLSQGLPCLLCSGVLDPEVVRRDLLSDEARAADPYIVGDAVPQPAVVSINSAASSLAVTMFLSAVVGIPVAARHQRLRLETGVVTRVVVSPRPACPVCSTDGALGRGDEWPLPTRKNV